jgi:hypothetical protein
MSKDEERATPAGVHEGTGAKGGKETLRSDEQEPQGVEPDSAVDAKLRESRRPPPGGLNPNSIVRNA